MKVLNLACQLGHRFEGWFGSEDDFQVQRQNGLLTCPVCGGDHVTKLPSAPRLNLKGGGPPLADGASAHQRSTQRENHAEAPGDAAAPAHVEVPARTGHTSEEVAFANDMRAVFTKALRAAMDSMEDVGDRFPEHARRMHHGEVESKAIRGQATLTEARELLEEGIDVVPVPFPFAKKNTLQ